MAAGLGTRIILLEDRISLRPRLDGFLSLDEASVDTFAPPVGILGWERASREELARLPEIRRDHSGPLLAVLEELPSARGARALSSRLEGAVLLAELERVLEAALKGIAGGLCVVSHAIRAVLERPPLSPRERQILAMVVLDFSNAEIARKLFVTESNVKNHLGSAFQKMGVSSRSAAVELILDHESGLGPGILRILPEESLPEERDRSAS